MIPFGSRLKSAIEATGPLCAGIDPSEALLLAWGLSDDPDGLAEFGRRCVEGFAGAVPIIKPQVAFFERHGSKGIAALEELIADARDHGLLVLADAKRGDIDSTSAAYAAAWSEGPLRSDAVTVTPYVGLEGLEPFFDQEDLGIFVVVRTSNPGGRPIQSARQLDGQSVEDSLLAAIGERNAKGTGSIGAVVGATCRPSGFDLADLGGPVLLPGIGAQGATFTDLGPLVGGCPSWRVLPSVSRSLLQAGPDPDALREAAMAMAHQASIALGDDGREVVT